LSRCSLGVVVVLAIVSGCAGTGDSREIKSVPPSAAAPGAGQAEGVGFDTATRIASSGVAAGCPGGMTRVGRYCIDKYEAHVVELDENGNERPHSPHQTVAGLIIRAKSAANVIPQAYISQKEAAAACANAGKRLCTGNEFVRACRGDDPKNHYPYGGSTRVPGYCNEGKGSAVQRFFGANRRAWTYENFNDPKLNQWSGGIAPTGSHPHCVSPHGVYDCVGNLHEWGADAPDAKGHGRFRGGFYGDAEVNGPGALYVTSAHEPTYHDYSTGFRCCADAAN
jgi:sulfatase modifying factor 1